MSISSILEHCVAVDQQQDSTAVTETEALREETDGDLCRACVGILRVHLDRLDSPTGIDATTYRCRTGMARPCGSRKWKVHTLCHASFLWLVRLAQECDCVSPASAAIA